MKGYVQDDLVDTLAALAAGEPDWRLRAIGPPLAVHDPRCALDPRHHRLTPCGPLRDLPTAPDPRRCDGLKVGTPEWARAWNRGHRCEQCGHSCGSASHHVQCCGTERQHRHTTGSYCSGHPCPACRGDEAVA